MHLGEAKLNTLVMFGDAMEGRGISDGDVVLYDPRKQAVDRSLVVARVNGSLVVRFYRERSRLQVLLAGNPHVRCTVVKPGETELLGEVVEVIGR